MAKGKILTQADINFLKKGLIPELKKEVSSEVIRTLVPQMKTAVSLVITKELTEQEEKYEKKLTKFKSEFFEKVDPILKEVTTAREERPIMVHKQEGHENRIEALEEIHPQGKHVAAAI